MSINVKTLKPGDVLTYVWLGTLVRYAKVLKVNSARVKVRGEAGGEVWKPVRFFTRKLTKEEAEKIEFNRGEASL